MIATKPRAVAMENKTTSQVRQKKLVTISSQQFTQEELDEIGSNEQ